MKRYFFEADRKQWEKPTEPNYLFCATAKVDVYADDEVEARILAGTKLNNLYGDSGILLDNLRLVDITPLPVDWSYGYDNERKTGDTAAMGDTVVGHIIR